MRYVDIRREVLGHINQYSIAGTQVASSYNNQADYLSRIPQLINEGLVNIMTLVKKEPVVYPLTDGERVGDFVRYTLPEDFFSLRTGGFCRVDGGHFERCNDYKLQGKRFLLVPASLTGSFTAEYYRWPHQLPLSPADDFELEEDLDVIQTATYYAAAQLVMFENEFAYASLYNDYESRLSRLGPGVTMEASSTDDVYGFSAGWGV